MSCRAFAGRNLKELLRDPISYIFCLGLPLLMLLLMTVVNQGIPAQSQMVIFDIDHLGPGIAVFSLTFVMLFSCLQVSKDRAGAFLIRLYASPMTAFDYIAGYSLPLLAVALGQGMITFASSAVIGAVLGTPLQPGNMLLSLLTLLPSAVLFMGFGMLFGSLLNDKAAPPVTSVLITVSALVGGIWMDVDMLGGALRDICAVLPFYHAVQASRAAMLGNTSGILLPLGVVSLYAAAVYTLAVIAFHRKMKSDQK